MVKEIKKYFFNKIGIQPTNIENLSGSKNRVYKIRVKDKRFILKIFPNDETSIRRAKTEAEIYKTYGDNLNFLPRLYFEDFTYEYLNFPIIYREYREGKDMKDRAILELKCNNTNNFVQLIENSITAANRIHELKTSDSFGTLFSTYRGSYLEFILYEKNLNFGLKYEQLYNHLSKTSLERRVLTNYIKGNNLITPQKFTLCHNDFRGHEILVNEDYTINGIIDWEQAIIGDPLGDFASHLFSLLNSVYDTIELQEKIIRTFSAYLHKNQYIQSLPFYLADRAILTSIVYYSEYNPKKFKWAMKFAKNMLSNSIEDVDDIIKLIKI